MSEEERFDSEESENEDVEAHKRRLAEEPKEQDDDSGDEVEAHRRRG